MKPVRPKRSNSENIFSLLSTDSSPPTLPSSGKKFPADSSSWLGDGVKVNKYLTRRERSYLAKHFTALRMPCTDIAQAKRMQKMFLRLMPYFRGTHHVEEIIWLESIREKGMKLSRADIEMLFEAFDSVLVTVEHESPVS